MPNPLAVERCSPFTTKPETTVEEVPDKKETHVKTIIANVFSQELWTTIIFSFVVLGVHFSFSILFDIVRKIVHGWSTLPVYSYA